MIQCLLKNIVFHLVCFKIAIVIRVNVILYVNTCVCIDNRVSCEICQHKLLYDHRRNMLRHAILYSTLNESF